MSNARVQQVVGVAILDRGRVLAARRSYPPELAGGWELPGGKVEPGESAEHAAVREVREELGCDIETTGWLDIQVPIAEGLELVVCTARLVSGAPGPTEHDRVRWLAADELTEVDWLPADRPFLPLLGDLLEGARR